MRAYEEGAALAMGNTLERGLSRGYARCGAMPKLGACRPSVCEMAVSDEELMGRVAKDDLAALGELFDRHQPALCAFVSRIVRNQAVAEDLVQDAFWSAWVHRASFDPGRRFSTWLYTIARRTALNELKRGERRAAPLSELSDAEQRQAEARAAEPTPGPGELAEQTFVRQQIQEALQALPEEPRICIVLREYHRKSYKEIGEIMGCSEGNARLVAHRARSALRALLRPLVQDEEAT